MKLETNAKFNPDNVILSDAKTGNIPTETGELIIGDIMQNSVIMQLAKYEPMEKQEKTLMYLAEGPGAYWVNEAEKIQTSKTQWLSLSLVAKKLGVIIPVSNEFLNYTVSNFFEIIKPKVAEAFRLKFDQAALFGTNSPYVAGNSIFERATAAGNIITGTDNVYADLNNAMALVEAGDHDPNAIATVRSLNARLRGAVDGNGLPMFNNVNSGAISTPIGLPIAYGNSKAWDKAKAELMLGDWNQAIYGIPQGLEYMISEDATLSTVVGEDGAPINLFERDLVALRATMHVAFLTVKEDAFAAVTPKSKASTEA